MKRRLPTSAALSLAALLSSTPAGADVSPAPQENLALGRPYVFSEVPSAQFTRLRRMPDGMPDVFSVLTDGRTERSASFWTKSGTVSFEDVPYVDVQLDLGEVRPIGEIRTRHGAAPVVSIPMPRREEYWVSTDGERFHLVGAFGNRRDPETVNSDAEREGMWRGVATFSSGALRAAGRYVLVRTFPRPRSRGPVRLRSYVGYDEIEVLRGDFDPAGVALDPATARNLAPARPGGFSLYEIDQPVWGRVLRKTPLLVGVVPQSFLGDGEFHLSVGGVYVVQFGVGGLAVAPDGGVRFECSFPPEVEVLDWSRASKSLRRHQGSDGTHFELDLTLEDLGERLRLPFFVVRARSTRPVSELGLLRWRYRYALGAREIDPGEQQLRFVLRERVEAPAPSRFLVFFWNDNASRHLGEPAETYRKLFSFYRDAGFRGALGQGGPAVHKALHALGLEDWTGKKLVGNGLALGRYLPDVRSQIPPEDAFQFHEDSPQKRRAMGRFGVCPTRLVSPEYDRLRRQAAREILEHTDDVWENWEPHMYQKEGCTCDLCRASFQHYTGLSDREVSQLWPDVVRDRSSDLHNAFSSWQYGEVVRVMQEALRAEGLELGRERPPQLVPAMHPWYLDPRQRYWQYHHPKEYLPHLERLSVWSYHNAINVNRVSADERIGNNLRAIPIFEPVRDTLKRFGHRGPDGELLPAVHVELTQFSGGLVLPRDYYWSVVLMFVEGWLGVGTWNLTFEQDARYLGEHARAHRLVRAFEDLVDDGEPLHGLELDPRSPLRVPPGGAVPVLYVRGFRAGARRVVAAGNDYPLPVYARLRWPGLEPGGAYLLVDEANRLVVTGDSGTLDAEALAAGVPLRLEPKQWHFLELREVDGAGALDGFARQTPASLEAALAHDLPRLRAFATAAEGA